MRAAADVRAAARTRLPLPVVDPQDELELSRVAFAVGEVVEGGAALADRLFEHLDHAKSIYIHRGEVVFAASNQQVDRLGEVLLRLSVITPEQFREAKAAYSPHAKFGRVLVERGFLSPRELWAGVKAQVEEIVRSLFAYGAGQVLFWEGEVRPDNVVRLSLPTRKLIALTTTPERPESRNVRAVAASGFSVKRTTSQTPEPIDGPVSIQP